MLKMSRRNFMNLVGAAALSSGSLAAGTGSGSGGFRVRTITAGVELAGRDDRAQLDKAAAFLERGKTLFGEQWEVQTTRVATQPLAEYLPEWRGSQAIARLVELDKWAQARNSMLSVGPVLTGGEGWHNNHHADPASASVQHRWWEIDVNYYIIRLFGSLGLASHIVAPRNKRKPGIAAADSARF